MRMSKSKAEGDVQEYPCDCHADDLTQCCWVVRHPALRIPSSFQTRSEAEKKLADLREKTKNEKSI